MARATAPCVASSRRRAGPVSARSSQTPTTTAPDCGSENSAKRMSIGAPWRDSLAETLLPRPDRRQPPMSSQCRRTAGQQYGLGKHRRRHQSGDRSAFSNSSARLSSSSAIRRSWLERGAGWVPAISRNRSARCRKKRASWREIICSLNELRCRNRGALQQVLPERRMRGEWRRNAVAGAGGGPYDPAVMTLAGIGFIGLMSLSAYFLPASNREFKDLQFEIRNRFVSSLLQEGTFTTISDKLTIYVGSRNERGEISGVLINDERDPQQPVTIFAERGAFADTTEGSRIILVNGNRQRYERASGKLSVLTFERYTLDLAMLRDAPVVRFREAQERFLGELFFPPGDLDATNYRNFLVEGHQRLAVPLSIFSFVIIPLACLLPGEFNRRGQLKRVLLAVVFALVFQSTDLGIKNLAASHYAAIPLMYVIDLLPLTLGFGMLLFGGIRFGFWRPVAAVAEPA